VDGYILTAMVSGAKNYTTLLGESMVIASSGGVSEWIETLTNAFT